MKTTFLKMILPVAAFALASAGAIETAKAEKNADVALIQGYRQTNDEDEPCEAVKMCNTDGQQFCTVNDLPTGVRLWHRINASSPCNITLYKPVP